MQRDISKVFYKVWHASLLHKQTSGWVFGLISSLPRNRWLRVVLDGKSSQEYSVNAGVAQLLKALFLILRFSYYTLTTFRMMVCVIYFIWDKVFKNGPKKNLWKTAFKNFTWSTLEYFVSYADDTVLSTLTLIWHYADDTILSTLTLIWHLICSNNYSWCLKLNLTYESL